MNNRRRLPSKLAILYHWREKLRTSREYPFAKEVPDFFNWEFCFACGVPTLTERCHITARINGGADELDNLHLLCRGCHAQSEMLSGGDYFLWFNLKNLKVYFQLWKKEYSFMGLKVRHIVLLRRRSSVSIRTKQGLRKAQVQSKLTGNGANFSEELKLQIAKKRYALALAANQPVSELINEHRQAGLSYRQIASKLNKSGYRTRSGIEFTAMNVENLYRRYILGGTIR